MFTNAENYNHGTGRLSRQLAVLFTDFVGVDPSAGFIEYARSQSAVERLEFQVGDAQNMPFVEASFDNTMALLVVGLFPDAASAAREMRRMT